MNQQPGRNAELDACSTQELIQYALTEADEDAAWEPVVTLHFRGTREVLDAACRLCTSPAARERELGADILGQLGVNERTFPAECFNCLAKMLRTESDPDVLESIAIAFGHLHDPRCIELLIPLNSHPDEDVRLGLVHGLMGHEDERAIATLIQLSSDGDEDVRDWSTFALGSQLKTDTPEIRAALMTRLADPDPDTRSEAIVGLAYRKDPEILVVLVEELSKYDVDELMVEAAESLASPRLYPVLLQLRERWPRERQSQLSYLDAAIAACTPGA